MAQPATLKSLDLLDSPAEEAFDRLTRLASAVTGAPVALVSQVDDRRQFFKSSVGLPEVSETLWPSSGYFRCQAGESRNMGPDIGPHIAIATIVVITAAAGLLMVPVWWGLSSPTGAWSDTLMDAWRSFRGPR